MIQFNFTGEPFPSFQQQAEDKAFFIDKLGPLKDEFDAKDGTATFNYSYLPTDINRIAFNIKESYPGEQSDFIIRWNEYIRLRYGHTS
jgi:hypothetical protein